MMNFAEILMWIAIGSLAAIAAGAIAVRIRNYRHRYDPNYPEQNYSVQNALDHQTRSMRGEMQAQEQRANAGRDERAEKVETALKQQEQKVENALDEQQKANQQEFAIQAETIEKALTNYQSTTKTDLANSTEIVKNALADSVKNRNGRGQQK